MTFKKTMTLSAMALPASLALLVPRLEADIRAREVADAPSRPALDRSVAGTSANIWPSSTSACRT